MDVDGVVYFIPYKLDGYYDDLSESMVYKCEFLPAKKMLFVWASVN